MGDKNSLKHSILLEAFKSPYSFVREDIGARTEILSH